jgi:hypothetical protein
VSADYFSVKRHPIGSSTLKAKTVFLDRQLPVGSCYGPTGICKVPSGNTLCLKDSSTGTQFKVELEEGTNKVIVTKSDGSIGWDIDLEIECAFPGARQTFCVSGTHDDGQLGHRCTTGLFFNGAPMDLRPVLGLHGIEFTFTDTSYGETAFEIVRGESIDTIQDGEIVVKVPYGLDGCGRQFSSIVFTDQQAMNNPGLTYVYGVRARNDGVVPTTMTTQAIVPYRVPWMGSVVTEVQTESDSPVSGALIRVCHFEGPHVIADICWWARTDVYGQAKVDVLVAKQTWTSTLQRFKITAVPENIRANCNGGTTPVRMSRFEPLSAVVQVEHFFSQVTAFTDTTAFEITGQVIFDPSAVFGSKCPVVGAVISILKGEEASTLTTDSDGRFGFSANRGEMLEVAVDYGKHKFKVKIDHWVHTSFSCLRSFTRSFHTPWMCSHTPAPAEQAQSADGHQGCSPRIP